MQLFPFCYTNFNIMFFKCWKFCTCSRNMRWRYSNYNICKILLSGGYVKMQGLLVPITQRLTTFNELPVFQYWCQSPPQWYLYPYTKLDLEWVLMGQGRSPWNQMKLPNSSQVFSSPGCSKFRCFTNNAILQSEYFCLIQQTLYSILILLSFK